MYETLNSVTSAADMKERIFKLKKNGALHYNQQHTQNFVVWKKEEKNIPNVVSLSEIICASLFLHVPLSCSKWCLKTTFYAR
jgi:hypothetical protein